MSRFSRVMAGLAGALLFCLGLVFGGGIQSPESSRTVPKTQLTGVGLAGLLSDLAARYQVPIGLEFVTSDASESARRTSMDLPAGTIGNLLDRIVASDPRYGWDELDGVIQVHPKNHREALLDVVIREFSVEGNRSSASVANSICHLPEVESKMKSLRITAFNPLDISMGKAILRYFSVHVRDVTLRDLLNDIARRSEFHFWSIGRWPPKNEIVTLEF